MIHPGEILTLRQSGGWKFKALRVEGKMIYGSKLNTSGVPHRTVLGFHYSHFEKLRDGGSDEQA